MALYPTSRQLPTSKKSQGSPTGAPPIYVERPNEAEAYRRAVLMVPGILALHLLWSRDTMTAGALAMSGLVAYLLRNAVTDQQSHLVTGLGAGVFLCGRNASTATRLLGGTAGMLVFAAPNVLLL